MDRKKLYYVIMASVIGFVMVLLSILIVSNLITIIGYDDSETVGIVFYIVMVSLEALALVLFGFIEFLLVKMIKSFK